jgi:hypothetical protein
MKTIFYHVDSEYLMHLEKIDRLDRELGFIPFKRDENGLLVIDFNRKADFSHKVGFWRKLLNASAKLSKVIVR